MLYLITPALVLLVTLVIWWKHRSSSRNVPPGPPSFPIVGSIFSFEKPFYKTMLKWQKQYGDVFSFRIGTRLFVMLSNSETFRNVLADENTAGRDDSSVAIEISRRNGIIHGVAGSEHMLWKTHRRFALSTLRDFGMGKSWLEDAVQEEVEDFCQQLKKECGKPFYPRTLVSHSVSNVICALIFGQRFAHTDEKFREMVRLFNESMLCFDKIAIIDIMPFMRYVPGQARTSLKTLQKIQKSIVEFFESMIKEHQERGAVDGRKDFIDAYMLEAESKAAKGEDESFTEYQLIMTLFDLFAAGTETTSTTTLWAICYLVQYPEVAKKVRAELSANVAQDQPVRMSDRALLPYTEATILEVQRLASLLPFNLPHRNFDEMTIDGFRIPANSILMTNIYFTHRHPELWKNPDQFDPTRFLDKDGKVTRPDGFMPFSIGKRACLGESLARMELWLFIANLVHRFDFKSAEGNAVAEIDEDSSLVLFPKPLQIIFESRN